MKVQSNGCTLPPRGNPKKSTVRVAHLIFSTAAESTSSLSHSPNALGVLSQRATLVGLITKRGKPRLATRSKTKTAPFWVLFSFWLRRQDLNLLGLWYPKLLLLRGGFASNFDHCPFDISLLPSLTALDIKASYSPKGS
ncbi:MAG: hypothetical protein IKU30_07715 [Clostridia bacterium]|nr:hypothetical protein [Clostridia bacterium]